MCENKVKRNQKTLYSLVINKRINEGTYKNQNRIVTNLSDIEVSDNEISLRNSA